MTRRMLARRLAVRHSDRLLAVLAVWCFAGAVWADAPANENSAPESKGDASITIDDQLLTPAQQHQLELYKSITWQSGPVTAPLGVIATVRVPEGFKLTTGPGVAAFLELTQNMPDPSLLGIMAPEDHGGWFMTFDYQNTGHVADDEKDKLDAGAILDSFREGAEASNAERKRRGWGEMHIDGWIQPPAYDPAIKNLTWALKGNSDGGEFANYNLRLLSRQGVMSVGLVSSPDRVAALIPKAQELSAGCEFTAGNKYGEFRAGDKVAEYGLLGLITGGAAIAAAKTGLLAKLGLMFAKFAKIIIIGALAVGAAIVKFFKAIAAAIGRLFGVSSSPSDSP